MLPVPTTFDAYADVRRVDFGFTFGIVATGAADAATASATAQYPASQLQQTHDRVELSTAPFVTLEHNLWLLNGSFQLYPKDLGGIQTGFISEDISGEDGNYLSPPILTFTFSQPQDSYGLTFRFDERIAYGWASEITLDFFDTSGKNIGIFTAHPTGAYTWVDAPVQQYSKVVITFSKSAVPKRRVRVAEVIFGLVAQYDKNNIVKVSDKQSVDLLSESLPSAELTVTIDNAEKLYNLINPSGVYEYLQTGQYINYWYSIGGEKINAGVRYFSTAKSDDGGLTATITFDDRLVALDNTVYNGGASGTWSLQEAITSILQAAGIQTPPTFSDDLESTIIRKCIPQDTTTREAIRLCAQAAMCCCYVDGNDSLHFVRPLTQTEPDEKLTRDRLESEPVVNVGERYNTVTIRRSDTYTDGEEESYTVTIASEGELQSEKEIQNDLVYDMETFANWALSLVQRRTYFQIDYRGNPAIEMCDTVQVFDIFGVNGMAIVEEHQLDYDGGLEGRIKARR